jgi:hypothetical protein
MNIIKKILASEALIATLLVTLTTIVTYGLLIPQLGYYRDDWYFAWTGMMQGPAGIVDLFKIDRPFMGVIYAFEYIILGNSPLSWHLYALFLKLVGAFAFLWLLRLMWPEKRIMTTFITLLFVIYPGFLQQPNANTFQNHLFGYAAAILSLAVTIRALKTRSRLITTLLHGLAICLTLIYLFIYEYMIGLEAARVFLIWYYIHSQTPGSFKKSAGKTLKHDLPYLLAVAVFLFWRVFIFKSGRRATNVDILFSDYSISPLRSVATILIETVKSAVETAVFAWFVPFYQFTATARYRDLFISLAVALVVIGFITGYLWLSKRNSIHIQNRHATTDENKVLIWLGAAIVVAALLPVTAAGRSVLFTQQWDRYTLQASIGVALLVVGAVFSYLDENIRVPVLCALIGLGVITQYHSAVHYRDFWNYERSAWWQLSWRAPDIDDGTTLMVVLPSGYQFGEDYEIWGPANMIYRSGPELKIQADIVDEGTLRTVLKGGEDHRVMRSIPLARDYSRAIIASMPAASTCLHVYNGRKIEFPEVEDPLVRLVAIRSRIDLIKTDGPPNLPPQDVFGQEPVRDWCFYYQKIDLARQAGDWTKAAQLADEAAQKGFRPQDVSEWMPVLEAYASTDQEKKANQAAKVIKEKKDVQFALCTELRKGAAYPSPYNFDIVNKLLCGEN